jgi:charged multivesicular body protein 6
MQLLQIKFVLNREHEIAKASLAAGHKDRAIVALRRRKYQESLLSKTDGHLESLQQLVCCFKTCVMSDADTQR